MIRSMDRVPLKSRLRDLNDAGFTVIDDFLPRAQIDKVRTALEPHLGRHSGRNAFEGFDTERVYTLVARGRLFEDLVEDPRLLAIFDELLLPGYLLTASQAINIRPGSPAQPLHVDDGFYRLPRPRPAVSYSMILAIDDFTPDNGATEVIAGSHRLESAATQAAQDGQGPPPRPMIMNAGACVVYSGALVHRAGANRSARPRLALTLQYCQPWARTQENYFLGAPRERVRLMSPRVQSLLGYDIWPPFMGHVTASHPSKSLEPGFVPPCARAPWSELGLWDQAPPA